MERKKIDFTDPKSYDSLECPDCDKLCQPVKVKKNGTVVYETHECNYAGGTDRHRFEINESGEQSYPE